MRKNQTTVLILELLLVGLMTSCTLFGNKSSGESKEAKTINNSNSISAQPKPSASDCPKATLSVNETKNKALVKYKGCFVSVEGKIWEVDGSSAIALIDTTEKTGYSNKIHIGGDFSSNDYYEIGRKISALKLNSQYEKLPVATFTGTVDSDGWLDNCVLTDVQK